MVRSVRSLTAGAAAAVALALPASAAATLSSSYSLSGFEYSATSTVGKFAGKGVGLNGDKMVWKTTVVHQALSSGCLQSGCSITGGGFEAVTENADLLTGAITGGKVAIVSGATGCVDQVFAVDAEVATNPGGFVSAVGSLTHKRVPIPFLGCVTYAGLLSLVLS